ncbi:MAG: glycosyltransferase family 4 protein [Prevotella sp.]
MVKRNKKKIIRAVTVAQSLAFCREVMIRMRKEGYDMVAVSSPGRELDSLREDDGFKCIEVPMERHISFFRDFVSLIRMIRVMVREKPYLVHSMTPKAGMICMIAAWLSRVPIRVHTFTGLVWPTATGLKRRILMATDWLTCACATHIIPEGQGVKNDLQSHITKKPMKVLGYGNCRGVDMIFFDPTRFSKVYQQECEKKQTGKEFTYLFVGRIVKDKGINELVEAFTKLTEKYTGLKLILVGSYEEKLDPVDEVTHQRIINNTSIVNTGEMYGDDLLKLYVDADCFVMPSYREGFPNVVLEAGAMGLPQIVTDINGSREIIIEGENGVIVPPRNTEALYLAMERMLKDKDARKRMAEQARSMIESRFEKRFVQGCQIEFYKEIMN